MSKTRLAFGAVFTAGGVALVVAGAAGGAGIGVAGLGAFLTILGFVVFGPVVARPAAAALGAPLPVLRRMTGKLARQNAMRNPRRTSATASALMVGIGVVTLFTVFAASLKVAVDDTVTKQFGGDLVINTNDFSSAGMSPARERHRCAAPGRERVRARYRHDDDRRPVERRDRCRARVVRTVARRRRHRRIDRAARSRPDRSVGADRAGPELVPRRHRHRRLRHRQRQSTAHGRRAYKSTELAGDYLIPDAAWDAHAAQPFDIVVMIELADGVSTADGKAAVQQVADRYFAPDVQTRQEYVDSVAGQIDQFLTVVYVLLILAIVIALMGIANTLSLSVHERTRELGLLRAVGQSRRQLRSMVRWESVIIAVFGTVGGVLVGLFLGWGLLEVTSDSQNVPAPYTVPVGQVLTVLVLGAIVGVLAGWRPARRAAKLDILEAIASD